MRDPRTVHQSGWGAQEWERNACRLRRGTESARSHRQVRRGSGWNGMSEPLSSAREMTRELGGGLDWPNGTSDRR